MEILRGDTSILDYEDKSNLSKWGQISGMSTLLVFGSLFLPVALLFMRQTPREQKIKYLRYGIIAQLGLGSIFLYSSYRTSNILDQIDKKYFDNFSLDNIRNYRTQVYNSYTPQTQSIGPALHGLNRAPFGGNPIYYIQPAPQPSYNQNTSTVENKNEGSKKKKADD